MRRADLFPDVPRNATFMPRVGDQVTIIRGAVGQDGRVDRILSVGTGMPGRSKLIHMMPGDYFEYAENLARTFSPEAEGARLALDAYYDRCGMGDLKCCSQQPGSC